MQLIIFARVSPLNWHIIYCNTSNIKCTMNAFVTRQINLCEWIMRGRALSNRPIVHYRGIMHYGGIKCCNSIDPSVSYVHA